MAKPHLTKKCASCGLEKPLSTFRILFEADPNAEYSNICTDCRKKQAQQEKLEEPEADTTSSGTVDRHTIDNKAKVAIESAKKQRAQEAKTRDHEEFRHETNEKNEIDEKKSTQTTDEKKVRIELFDSLTVKKTSPTLKKQAQKTRQSKNKQQNFLSQKEFDTAELHKKEHEQIQKDINDFNFSSGAPTHSLKYQSITFKQFLAVVGEGSALARNLNKLQEKQTTSANNEAVAEPSVEDLTTHLNKPTSTRRR